MNWKSYINGFVAYLKLEKGLAANSIEAYLRDVDKLVQFLSAQNEHMQITEVKLPLLQNFIQSIAQADVSARSQARIISGIKAFFKYLVNEDVLPDDPSQLLEGPKLSRELPAVLSLEEIESMMLKIDHSKPAGHRNRAMLETLYGCGLRVTELIELKISNLFFQIGFIKVIGKGNKERLVPINPTAIEQIGYYQSHYRLQIPIVEGEEDFLFLNRRGKHLSRVFVFKLIKKLALDAGIQKNIGPHSFRHSFATHMYERGADLRAIQEMLGHASITTTEIYAHVNNKYLRETFEAFHPRFQVKEK